MYISKMTTFTKRYHGTSENSQIMCYHCTVLLVHSCPKGELPTNV